MLGGFKRSGVATIGAVWLLLAGCADRPEPYRHELTALKFMPDAPCVEMTPEEARRSALALEVLESFSTHASIYRGAVDVFGRPRDADPSATGEIYCVPENTKHQIARLTVQAGGWRGLVGTSYLNLAFQLGPRDPAIVQAVGRHAFADRPIEEGIFEDTRPLARSVLASFGTAASPWRDQAMAEMSADDALGTSAAQVAAASGDADAIRQVAALLRKATNAEPEGEAIRIEAVPRITELAFALGAAREQARPYAPMLIRLLNRDFTIGSHFGALELAPTSMCRVLAAIGGSEAEAAIKSPRCKEDWHKWP